MCLQGGGCDWVRWQLQGSLKHRHPSKCAARPHPDCLLQPRAFRTRLETGGRNWLVDHTNSEGHTAWGVDGKMNRSKILFSPLRVSSIPTLATMPFASEKYPKPACGTDGCYWWADPRSLETQRERVSGWGLLWQKQSGVEGGSLAASPQPSPARVSAFARASVLFSGPAVTRAPNFTAVQFQVILLFPSCSAILLEFVCHQL